MKMKREVVHSMLTIALAGVMAVAFTGCDSKEGKTSSPGAPGGAANGGKAAAEGGDDDVRILANSGPLSTPVWRGATNGNTDPCFPITEGWHRYYFPERVVGSVTNLALFCGPSARPGPFDITNANNLAWLTITTCTNANGTTLKTGIKIINEDTPLPAYRRCATNEAACNVISTLSTLKYHMVAGAHYRVTVFVDTNTVGALPNITIHYLYSAN